jgi:hypothetical protein
VLLDEVCESLDFLRVVIILRSPKETALIKNILIQKLLSGINAQSISELNAVKHNPSSNRSTKDAWSLLIKPSLSKA